MVSNQEPPTDLFLDARTQSATHNSAFQATLHSVMFQLHQAKLLELTQPKPKSLSAGLLQYQVILTSRVTFSIWTMVPTLICVQSLSAAGQMFSLTQLET
jgi:hypothetical protein